MSPLRCDVCGQFISWLDIKKGRAVRHLETSDTDYSLECYETLCPKDKDK